MVTVRAAVVSVIAFTVVGLTSACSERHDTLSLGDDARLAVLAGCVEFDMPNRHASTCEPSVGASVVGEEGDQWLYGLAPADAVEIVAGDRAESRFLDFEGLNAFAIPFSAGTEVSALDDRGRAMYTYTDVAP